MRLASKHDASHWRIVAKADRQNTSSSSTKVGGDPFYAMEAPSGCHLKQLATGAFSTLHY
jgi:hypothetical protein